MTRIPPASLARPITLGAGAGSVTVVFDKTGAITSLKVGSGGVEWAIPERPLAQYVYQTLNDSEWIPWSADYINGGKEEKTQLARTANCIIIDHFSAFESGLVAPFLYAA